MSTVLDISLVMQWVHIFKIKNLLPYQLWYLHQYQHTYTFGLCSKQVPVTMLTMTRVTRAA